jgi:hypothetical protein
MGPEGGAWLPQTVEGRQRLQIQIESVDGLTEPERAVVLQRETAAKNDKTLHVIAAVEFEIRRGKITEVTVHQHDTYAFDEFRADNSNDEDGRDDIQSELETSAREAGLGSSPEWA